MYHQSCRRLQSANLVIHVQLVDCTYVWYNRHKSSGVWSSEYGNSICEAYLRGLIEVNVGGGTWKHPHYVNNAISRHTPHGHWPRRVHSRRTRGLLKTGHTGIASLTLVSDSSLHRRWKFTHPPHLSHHCHFIGSRGGALRAILFTANPLTPASQTQGLEGGSGCRLGEPL